MRPPRLLLQKWLLLSLLAGARASAAPYLSASSDFIWQDNIANVPVGSDTPSGTILEAEGDARWTRSVDFSTIVSLTLDVRTGTCFEFHGLDYVSPGSELSLLHKFGIGAYVPVLTVGIQAQETDIRDSARTNFQGTFFLRYAQRMSDDLQVVVTGNAFGYDARNNVYTGDGAGTDAAINYDLTDSWRVKALGSWRRGDVVTNYDANDSGDGWGYAANGKNYYYSHPWKYVTTYGEPYVAYRLRGQTWGYGAGISPALGPEMSLTLQFVRDMTTTDRGRYVNDLVSVSLVRQF